MTNPESPISQDAALSSFMSAAIGDPETSRAAPEGDTVTRTGNTADHQDGWFAGIDHGRAEARDIAAAVHAAPMLAAPAVRNWQAVQAAIDDYLEGYELRLDEGCHTPTEFERFMLVDAIAGLMADDEFIGAMLSAISTAPGCAQDPSQDAMQVARWKRDSELLDALQSACWDVRFISHSNGDDYSIGIEIVSHFMQRPRKRVIGENWNENLRAALEQAITAEAYPPARPERTAPAAGDAQDAQRYRAWRDAMMAEDTEFRQAVAAALPSDVGDTRPPTSAEWDAAIDAATAAQQGKGDGA